MGGRELYGHIRRISPNTRILFSTGFSDDSCCPEMAPHLPGDIIRKPYTVEALSQKISLMMLDSGNRAASS
jgi:hypothetical protein